MSSLASRAPPSTKPAISIKIGVPCSSLSFLRRFLRESPSGEIDASEILGHDCFQAWLLKKPRASNRERNFQRTVNAHISGLDGRAPFSSSEEAAVLREVRQKQVWPCFVESDKPNQLGRTGFRGYGYHEKHGCHEKHGSSVGTSGGDSDKGSDSDQGEQSSKSPVSSKSSVLHISMPNVPAGQQFKRQPAMQFIEKVPPAAAAKTPTVPEDFEDFLTAYLTAQVPEPPQPPPSLRYFPRGPHYAVNLLERIILSQDDPSIYIIVADLAVEGVPNRVLAQNDRSRVLLGDLTQHSRMFLARPQVDAPRVAGAVQLAFLAPGKEQRLDDLYISSMDGKERKCVAVYIVDPGSFLAVTMGKVID
jgi:hypothetical protein